MVLRLKLKGEKSGLSSEVYRFELAHIHPILPVCTIGLILSTRPLPRFHSLCYFIDSFHSGEASKAPAPYWILMWNPHFVR